MVGCTLSTGRLNEEEDKATAVKFLEKFYQQIEKKEYKNSLSFYADTFLKTIDSAKLFKFYRHNVESSGEVKSFSLEKCETKSINTDGKNITVFLVMYNVKRSVKSIKERFVLKSFDKGEPKIYRYDVLEDAK